MDWPVLMTRFIGAFLIVAGFLYWYPPFVNWYVRWRNAQRGLKTTITPSTFTGYRIGGIVMIIMGIASIVLGPLVFG